MKTARVIFAVLLVLLLATAFTLIGCKKKEGAAALVGKKLKAGFVYIGPVGDSGWTFAHDQGRKYAISKLPWLETVFVESVPEGDSTRILDRLVQEEKCDVVLTTSFGYMDDTIKAGERYPNKLFMHCSGFKNLPNVGTYFAELYQMYYLNGLMAGALTKTGKVGYVGAFPIPEVVRHLNAFALGIKAANPKAKMQVRWIYSWYDPAKAKEAAEALVADGCDAMAFTEDSASVVEVGQEHTKAGKPVYTFGHYSPMQQFGQDSCVSGQLVDWGVMYERIFQDIHNGTWKPDDMWWLAKEGAAKLGGSPDVPVNPKFVDALKAKQVSTEDLGSVNVYDLVMKRYEQMMKGRDAFDPFTGPITDNKGKVQIPTGRYGTKDEIMGPAMAYYVDNITGDLPK